MCTSFPCHIASFNGDNRQSETARSVLKLHIKAVQGTNDNGIMTVS